MLNHTAFQDTESSSQPCYPDFEKLVALKKIYFKKHVVIRSEFSNGKQVLQILEKKLGFFFDGEWFKRSLIWTIFQNWRTLFSRYFKNNMHNLFPDNLKVYMKSGDKSFFFSCSGELDTQVSLTLHGKDEDVLKTFAHELYLHLPGKDW